MLSQAVAALAVLVLQHGARAFSQTPVMEANDDPTSEPSLLVDDQVMSFLDILVANSDVPSPAGDRRRLAVSKMTGAGCKAAYTKIAAKDSDCFSYLFRCRARPPNPANGKFHLEPYTVAAGLEACKKSIPQPKWRTNNTIYAGLATCAAGYCPGLQGKTAQQILSSFTEVAQYLMTTDLSDVESQCTYYDPYGYTYDTGSLTYPGDNASPQDVKVSLFQYCMIKVQGLGESAAAGSITLAQAKTAANVCGQWLEEHLGTILTKLNTDGNAKEISLAEFSAVACLPDCASTTWNTVYFCDQPEFNGGNCCVPDCFKENSAEGGHSGCVAATTKGGHKPCSTYGLVANGAIQGKTYNAGYPICSPN